eukprot:TRINITY_DN4571_c0_g1_i3.p1 TRINITY_DN4571_c0_g1~~TRINITY_DN4571_c0_g1_i3.p1  ORF type:complete len:313 (-),score=48.12 TRINITY_DN4571_c0_g1_i3:41-979(-)
MAIAAASCLRQSGSMFRAFCWLLAPLLVHCQAHGVCLLQRGRPSEVRKTRLSEAADAAATAVPTLVINLDSRPDRWTRMQGRLRYLNNSGVLQTRRFRATDADLDFIPQSQVRSSWRTDRNAPYVGLFYMRSRLNLSSSERACAHSHIRAWQEIAESEVPMLVLEDDAVLSPSLAERLPLALSKMTRGEADMLYLGYSEAEPLQNEVSEGIYQATYLWTTIGYMLWPSAARKLIAALPVDQPVDNFIAWQVKRGRIRAFAASPKLIEPEHAWDILSNVEHSDEQGGFLFDRVKNVVLSPFRALKHLVLHSRK